MKKYITIAALLAAGTSLVNAANVDLVTTFSGANQSTVDGVSLSVVGTSGVTATADLTSLTASSGAISVKNGGAAGNAENILTPNTNVGNGAPWTAEFIYTLSGVEVTGLTGLDLDVVLFSGSGAYQGTNARWTGDVEFTATIKDNEGSSLGTLTGSLNPSPTDAQFSGKNSTPFEVALTCTNDDPIDLSSMDSFTVSLALTESLNAGCFVGLSEMTAKVSAVPEPSAFGLISGVGALALVASRRRRK